MKILLFGINKGHIKFFEKIKKHSKCNVKIVFTKKLFLFSFKSLKYINQVNFDNAIKLRVKDFYARRDNSIIPKFLVKFSYKLLAIYNYMRYFNYINQDFDKIMLWNGMTFRQAIAIEIAKLYNIKPIFIENAFLPNRIVIDKKGVNFYNSVPRTYEFYKNYTNTKSLPKELIPRNPKNAKKFSSLTKEKLPDNYIFVPFQVDYDTQIMLFSPWIKNMRHLFKIIEDISNKTNYHFVFKEHPSSIKDYPDLHKKIKNNPKLHFANAYPTQELIQKSDAVITVNSSVGVESLLFHKKVLVLGESFYAIENITKKINNKDELIYYINHIEKLNIDFNVVDKFLKYLYYDYLIEGNFKEYNEKQIKKIETILGC